MDDDELEGEDEDEGEDELQLDEVDVPVPHVRWQERLPSAEAPFDLVSASNALVTMPAEAVEATMLALW